MSHPDTEPRRWTVYRIHHDVAADTAERAISLTLMTPLTEIRAFDAEAVIDATATAEQLAEVSAENENAQDELAHMRWRYHQVLRWLLGSHTRCSATSPMGNYQCLLADGHSEQVDARGHRFVYHTDGSSNW